MLEVRFFCNCGMLTLISIFGVSHSLLAQDPKPRVVIGKDTTFIDGPLTEDGYIDYIRYINEKQSKGVDAKENVVAALAKILSLEVENLEYEKKFLKALGLSSGVDKEDCFVGSYPFSTRGFDLKSNSVVESKRWQSEFKKFTLAATAPWSEDQFPIVANWLNENERFLDQAIRASNRKQYFNPKISMSLDGPKRTLSRAWSGLANPFRGLGQALTIRSLLYAGNGDFKKCSADLLATRKLARLIGKGYFGYEKNAAMALLYMASKAEIAIAISNRFSGKQLLELAEQAQKYGINFDIADSYQHEMRFSILDNMQIAQRHGFNALIENNFALYGFKKSNIDALNQSVDFYTKNGTDWVVAKQLINERVDKVVEILRTKDPTQFSERFKEHSDQQKKLREEMQVNEKYSPSKLLLLGPKKRGIEIARLFQLQEFSRLEQDSRSQKACRVENDLAVHVLAVKAYQTKQGRYPDSLKQLNSKAVLPDDPFSNEPYIYRRTTDGFMVYSVGKNLADDMGDFDGEGRYYVDKDWGIQIPRRKKPE